MISVSNSLRDQIKGNWEQYDSSKLKEVLEEYDEEEYAEETFEVIQKILEERGEDVSHLQVFDNKKTITFNKSMKVLMSLKGTNGKIIAYEDGVTISRKTLVGFIKQGIVGDKTFFYSQLSSVEYRKPTFLANGYLKFITGGTKETSARVGLFGTTTESMRDSNTVILRAFKESIPRESEELYNLITTKIKEQNSTFGLTNNISSADELKKYYTLFEEGVIIREEYEAKKIQLLGL